MNRLIFWLCWSIVLGASLVAYSIHDDAQTLATFRTQNLIVDETSNLGDVTHVTNVNGPTRQTMVVPGGAYAFGEINLSTISGVGPDSPADIFVHVIRNSTTWDTTAAPNRSGGIAVEVTSTRTSGANDLRNVAFECTAQNGQENFCIQALFGDVQIDNGNLNVVNGYGFFTGPFLATGPSTPLIAEGNGARAIYISADPGPTDSIYSAANNPSWNAHNALASVLTLYNDSAQFTLRLMGPAGAAFAALQTPDGIVAITAGAFGAGSTTLIGDITGVGATTTTITYANAFPTRSRCFAQTLGATPQFITVVNTATQATFNCFAAATGLAANCEDFNYTCTGQ